jgi:hypothetical protein
MQLLEYDPSSDCYWTEIDGQHVWCKCPTTLDDILHRLDERETRREDARGTWVAILLAAVLIAVAAWLAGYF